MFISRWTLAGRGTLRRSRRLELSHRCRRWRNKRQIGFVDTRWGIRGWHVCCRGVRGRGFGLRVLTPYASFACPTVAGRRILRPRSLAHDVHARLGTEPSSRLASGGAEPLPRLVCSGLQRLGQGSLKARGQLRELRSRRMALRAELTEHLHMRGVAERGIFCVLVPASLRPVLGF